MVVREVIAAAGDVNVPRGDGYTALHFASRMGKVKAASLLIEAGADVKSKGIGT